MSRRYLLLTLSAVGLALSVWAARPANPSNLNGWLFALGWPSIGWWALFLAAIICVRASIQLALVGALVALAALEIVLFIFATDPLMLAVKPFYQVPLAVVSGLTVFFIGRNYGQQA